MDNYKGFNLIHTQSGVRVYIGKSYIEFPSDKEAQEWIDEQERDE